MKTFLSLVLVSAMAAGSAFAADQFEGRMKMKITADGKSQEVAYAIKGGKMRVEMNMEGKPGAMIMDMNAREMIMLMPQQKMYMVMPMKDMVEAAQSVAKTDNTVLEKTNETEKILGYKATKYLAKDADGKAPVEIWAAEGIGHYINPNSISGPMGRNKNSAQPWERELREKGFFPLRTVAKDRKGKETRMEVTSLEKEKLADSLFNPPADYQKFAIPGLGGLIPGMGGK